MNRGKYDLPTDIRFRIEKCLSKAAVQNTPQPPEKSPKIEKYYFR